MLKIVICSLTFVLSLFNLNQKEDPRLAGKWQIESIETSSTNIQFSRPVYIELGGNGQYAFTNFTVNACGGVFTSYTDEKITIQPADCTEACCDTDNERSLMTLLPKMNSYTINFNTLTFSGEVEGNIVFNAFKVTPDNIEGAVKVTLQKVETK